MRPRLPVRIRRPAPATVIATLALVLAVGGFAVAAIPEPDGKIHACYKTTGGNLRVVSGTKCGQGEKALSWNQGVSKVTVRKATVTINYTCTEFSPGTYLCTGTASNAALCLKNERATGGGYALPVPTGKFDSLTVRASRPGPPSGTPNRWFVTVFGTGQTNVNFHQPTNVPIYAVCAA